MVNERRWLVCIFILYFLLATGYSLLMPIWEAPDEAAHYHLAHYDEYASLDINYEAHQPRGFYYLGSWIISALDELDPELTRYQRPREYPFTIRQPVRRFEWTDANYRFIWGVYLLRWVNISFGGIALWLHWKTFKQISPRQASLCLAALALAALTPQYLHIMLSVNNDALGALAGALLFYLAIRISGIYYLAIVLPFITKLSVLPVGAAVLMVVVWKGFSGQASMRWLVCSGFVLLAGAGLIYWLFPEITQSAAREIE